MVIAGAKRIDEHRATEAYSLSDSATTTSNTGYFPAVAITNSGFNRMYDHLDAIVSFADMTGTDTALGNIDTAIVTWKFRFGDSIIVARVDTALPPCKFIYNYSDYLVNTGVILGDSTAIIYTQSIRPFLYYDAFWFEYNVSDSALAVDSTGTTVINYTVRLTERWE